MHAVPGRPILLLLDGHSSHFDPETIRCAKDHDVIIFCLPPHTTHEAQPLDINFLGTIEKELGGGMSQLLPVLPRKGHNKV